MSFKNDLISRSSYYKLNIILETENKPKKHRHTRSVEFDLYQIKNSITSDEKITDTKILKKELKNKQDKSKVVVVYNQSKEQNFLNLFKDRLKKSEVANFKKVVTSLSKNTITLPQINTNIL